LFLRSPGAKVSQSSRPDIEMQNKISWCWDKARKEQPDIEMQNKISWCWDKARKER